MTNSVSEETISSIEKASLSYRTLTGLADAGIRYCLWKSFDRLEEGIRGDTDFDILMDSEQKQMVFDHLAEQGWFLVNAEPWRRFPEVYDYFQYDAHYEKFIHMHVHFKLVMGEKMVKSLCLPLESLYLKTAIEAKGVFHAMPELELCVFILRLTLKIGWRDYARIIKRGDRKMIYRSLAPEFHHIHNRCDRARLITLLENPALSFVDANLVLETYEDFYSLDFGRRLRIKKFMAPYRRYGAVARFFVDLYRCQQKKYFGQGKVFPGKGVSFAFCGPDGSGKTTLVDSIEKHLTRHFKVARFYMGGNQLSKGIQRKIFFLICWAPYLLMRKFFKLTGFQPGVQRMEQLYFGFEYFLIAMEKKHRYRMGKLEAERGAIVLYERFPLFPDGGDRGTGDHRAFFEKNEQDIYEQIKSPDIIFILQVDARTAIERKPDHKPDVIRKKTEAFDEFINKNRNDPRIVVLDANASMDLVVKSALNHTINREFGRDS